MTLVLLNSYKIWLDKHLLVFALQMLANNKYSRILPYWWRWLTNGEFKNPIQYADPDLYVTWTALRFCEPQKVGPF